MMKVKRTHITYLSFAAVLALLLMLSALPAAAQGTIEPTPTPWEGDPGADDFDGRIEGQQAEPYTVYCQGDYLEVYLGTGHLLRRVPLTDVLAINPNGGTWYAGNGITIQRSNDSAAVSGYNGNFAPEYGVKRFNLRTCIGRNGSLPLPTGPDWPGNQGPQQTAYTQPSYVQPTTPVTAYGTVPQGGCTYTVKPGDTALQIAITYNTTLNALRSANGYDLNRIEVGQRLVVPTCSTGYSYTGSTTTTTNVSITTTVSTGSGATHVVRAGENLYRIGLRYGTSVHALMVTNNITDVRRLAVGQVLIIP